MHTRKENKPGKKPFLHWRRLRGGFYMAFTLLLLMVYYHSLPYPLFNSSYSTVLEDKHGELLGAKIADDHQWRFPVSKEIPEKFKTAIIEFEDNNFYRHPGIDPVAIGRAVVQNFEAGEVISGASTLTMQVIRLAKQNPDRTVLEKLKEMIQATRLELSYSKEEIMSLYAAHAPFGGNVVGLEAASWRYFGRSPESLSWAEATMLAILPNSPALIHPGRNRDVLKAKRDRLLERLYQQGKIDSLTFELAVLEPLPKKPHKLPNAARHYLARFYSGEQSGKKVQSGIDQKIQQRVNGIVEYHHQQLKANGIYNMGVVVLDVKSQSIITYVGNTNSGSEHSNQVDVVVAPRSTGSILKPLLYSLKLNQGELLPNTLVPDVPSRFSEYSPKNFTRTYSGAVPASEALARSLNVPAVYMLQEFSVPKFHHYLNEFGLSTITKAPEHYGLTLILGGAEASLIEITSTYASLAYQLNEYDAGNPKESNLFKSIDFENSNIAELGFQLSSGAVWSTFEAMKEVVRPEEESFWRRFDNARKVAWKTGTSYGHRDGWAVGVTPEYVVGVWVGNADGEGRPNLTGIKTAGPVLFDVFNSLPETSWFNEPVYELEKTEVCALSGHRAGQYCEKVDTVSVPKSGLKAKICPYHKLVHVNNLETHRVNSACTEVSQLKTKKWFVLPADQEWYYRKSHPEYKNLPPVAVGCEQQDLSMKLIYPFRASSIYVPMELDGNSGKAVFEVAHRQPDTKVYWHLNDQFLGETNHFHQISISPEPGKYRLTLVDEYGERLEHKFEIVSR
ncbi:MAG: penicillin-binding protein 1C [Balneolaceae bacterium]|nr:penicillin-binding protein 1C [Balneolaceae bacterium]MBO6545161.1 penicillin-binding protein 1C [Balneolaceae bacterium]MBO6646557.1 penicillin-binding protein 1C [Balneolaceae bacterium]